jgi:hypothetical protein
MAFYYKHAEMPMRRVRKWFIFFFLHEKAKIPRLRYQGIISLETQVGVTSQSQINTCQR